METLAAFCCGAEYQLPDHFTPRLNYGYLGSRYGDHLYTSSVLI